MGMRVEDEKDGFGREPVNVTDQFAGAAGIIGVDDDKVVLHLDHDVIAVAFRRIAGEKPDTVGNPERVEAIGVCSVRERREKEQE
jgi:hypothetical protein